MRSRLIVIALIITIFNSKFSLGQHQNDTTKDYGSLMINICYTNNDLEYITESTEKIPTLFSNISYFHKSGFYAGFGYSSYFSNEIQSQEYDLNGGYQKYFENGFDVDLSYNWHKFNGDSLLEGLNYNHSASLMFGWEVEKFYFSSELLYTNGKTNNFFFDVGISRYFQIEKIFTKNDVIMISPTLSISFGTDNWLYDDMTYNEKLLTLNDLKSAGYNSESFTYEGFDIFIPISYGINKTFFTFSWLYKIPGNKYDYLGWQKQSGIMFSLTYFLEFKK